MSNQSAHEPANNGHHLSLQLMQEYLEENLPDTQMHQIERHLLDCELCADAMEGLSFMPDPDQVDDSINELKRKVRKRSLREPVLKKKKKKAPLLWRHISVAAATIVMVVGIVLVFRLNGPKKNLSPVSLKEERAIAADQMPATPAPAAQPPVYSDATPVEKSKPAFSPPVSSDKPSNQALFDSSPRKKAVPESNVSLSPEVALDQIEEQIKNDELVPTQESIQTVPQTVLAEAKREASQPGVLAKKPAPVPSEAIGITQNFVTISGKVAAASDTTVLLQGVKVTIKGTNKSMLTDYRGRFSMAVPPGSTLLFSLEGMINAEANVANRKTLNVLLKREGMEEDTADIAFVEPVEEDNLSYKPQPENGTMSYRNYLKKNLKYPEEARKHNIQGNVRVEFTVMPDGKLAGFMIKRGLGYGCDEEALRLVQEGPAWKPALANGKKVEKRITVFVPFKL
jgi:TonB family protein